MSRPRTVNTVLEGAAGRSDVGLRILDRHERPTWLPWSEIYRRSMATCGGLQRLGVQRGDRVTIILPTCAEFFDAFFGVLLAGAVPVPLYPPVRLGRLDEYSNRTARMIDAVGSRLVLTDRRVRRLLGTAVLAASPPLGCHTIDALPQASAAGVPVTEHDLALIQFSSGTTVEPKPVALNHRALMAQTALINSHWPHRSDRLDSGVSWLPLYHDMGLIGCVLPAVERPGTLTLIPPELFVARPALWLRAISTYRATLSVAPNFGYGLCVDRIRDDELEGVDLSCWRVALNGAETVVPRVARAFSERFASWGLAPETVTPVYGLSEAALAVTFGDLDRPLSSCRFDREALSGSGVAIEATDGAELTSVGRPLEGFDLRVVDGDPAVPLPDGDVGRILIRGPSLMEGYYGQAEQTREVLRDGWLDTGDLGFIHDGELFLTGRAKDVLLLRGRSHSPAELEAAMDGVDGVRTGCAVAVSWLPEEADGERLLLLVEARRGLDSAEYPAVANRCAEAARASAGLDPDEVAVLAPGTLPRTSSGKLRRQDSLQRFLDGSLQPPQPVTPLRLAAAMTRSSIDFARSRFDGSRGS